MGKQFEDAEYEAGRATAYSCSGKRTERNPNFRKVHDERPYDLNTDISLLAVPCNDRSRRDADYE